MDSSDLAAYLHRIGHDAPLRPDLATLAALVARHRRVIAFENFDLLARRVPTLEPPALVDKLVRRRRGGHCFEQNGLLRAVLEHAGFAVRTLEGRVRTGPAHEPRTHEALRVDVGGALYLADVGFGALSPAAPLALAGGREAVEADGESWRLASAASEADGALEGWRVQTLSDRHWHDVVRLYAVPSSEADAQMASWYVATHPQAMLQQHLVVSRPLGDGRRLSLLDDRLTLRHAAGRPERRHLANRAEFAEVLAEGFGLAIPPEALDNALDVIEHAA